MNLMQAVAELNGVSVQARIHEYGWMDDRYPGRRDRLESLVLKDAFGNTLQVYRQGYVGRGLIRSEAAGRVHLFGDIWIEEEDCEKVVRHLKVVADVLDNLAAQDSQVSLEASISGYAGENLLTHLVEYGLHLGAISGATINGQRYKAKITEGKK